MAGPVHGAHTRENKSPGICDPTVFRERLWTLDMGDADFTVVVPPQWRHMHQVLWV